MPSPSLTRRLWICSLAALAAASAAPHKRHQSEVGADPSLCKLVADPSVRPYDVWFPEDIPSSSQNPFVSSIGTLKTAMIFIDFPDARANETTDSLYNIFVPSAPNWFHTASYGKLNLSVTAPAKRFFRMPAASTSYGVVRNLSLEAHHKYIQEALSAVGTQIDFTGIEILYIVATTAAKAITLTAEYPEPVIAADGNKVPRTVTFSMSDPLSYGYKDMNHETGHCMGLPDLYPLQGSWRETTKWTGGFDLMSSVWGVAPDYFAWHKWKLGWLEDQQIGCVPAGSKDSATFVLSPLEVSADNASAKKAVVVAYDETNALVAEARTRKGVDNATCAEGVLIYAVYTDVESGAGPIRVFDSMPESRGCRGDELNDAPFDDATLDADDYGVSIQVSARHGDSWTVTVVERTENTASRSAVSQASNWQFLVWLGALAIMGG